MWYRGLGRPQGLALDKDGNVFVAASLHGRRGLVRVTPQGEASLVVSGNNMVGVAFSPLGTVVLATGGYAGLWARSSNPPGSNGTGVALAWEAGAAMADMEFVQFHPTALDLPGAPAFLLSEALRGEGALLVDSNGREIQLGVRFVF